MQKTAYEMRISDWSSDVCSSDLCSVADGAVRACRRVPHARRIAGLAPLGDLPSTAPRADTRHDPGHRCDTDRLNDLLFRARHAPGRARDIDCSLCYRDDPRHLRYLDGRKASPKRDTKHPPRKPHQATGSVPGPLTTLSRKSGL